MKHVNKVFGNSINKKKDLTKVIGIINTIGLCENKGNFIGNPIFSQGSLLCIIFNQHVYSEDTTSSTIVKSTAINIAKNILPFSQKQNTFSADLAKQYGNIIYDFVSNQDKDICEILSQKSDLLDKKDTNFKTVLEESLKKLHKELNKLEKIEEPQQKANPDKQSYMRY